MSVLVFVFTDFVCKHQTRVVRDLHFICQVNLKLSTLFRLFELSCFVIGKAYTIWYITCKQLIDLYVYNSKHFQKRKTKYL